MCMPGLCTWTSTLSCALLPLRVAAGAAAASGSAPRPFVGAGARGLSVPTRIAVVARGQVAPDLDDAEHPAHLERAEGPVAAHHRRGVGGGGHLHVAHVGHA